MRKSTHVLETGGERIRNVFEMEGALPERKASAFQVLGKCPSKSADGRGERFMKKPHRLPAGAASTLRRDRLLAGSASTEEPAVMKSSTRRLIIDRLLAERGVVPFELFEEVLRVSAPTIKRDLRYMREELGAPIQTQPEAL